MCVTPCGAQEIRAQIARRTRELRVREEAEAEMKAEAARLCAPAPAPAQAGPCGRGAAGPAAGALRAVHSCAALAVFLCISVCFYLFSHL